MFYLKDKILKEGSKIPFEHVQPNIPAIKSILILLIQILNKLHDV